VTGMADQDAKEENHLSGGEKKGLGLVETKSYTFDGLTLENGDGLDLLPSPMRLTVT